MVAIHRRASGLSRIERWSMTLEVSVAARSAGLLAADRKMEGEAVLPGSKATRTMTLTDRLGSAPQIGYPEAGHRQPWQGMQGRRLCR